MGRCKIAAILFGVIPSSRLRRALIDGHLLRCPACRRKAAGPDEAKAATVSMGEIGPLKDFWPAVSRRLEAEATATERARRPRRSLLFRPRTAWRWAAGAASLLVLAGVLLVTRPQPPGTAAPEDRTVKLRIENVRIYDEPAQAFIFKTQDPDWTFVWVEKR